MAASRVVFISVDGLIPSFYLDESWPAPAMQEMVREGAHARAVRTIFPALSYPGHTTMATGALPARHGIWHNRETTPVSSPAWLKDASRIRVPALWDAVRASGKRSAAVLWPMTAGAKIDWCLPDIWPGKESEFVRALRENAAPRGLVEEIEREVTGPLTPDNFSNRLLTQDLRLALIARYLFEKYEPDLLLVHAQSSNQVLQEPDWRSGRRRRAIAASDQMVSVLSDSIERAKAWDTTTLIVAGDHGNMEVHTQIRPNLWLIDAGLRGRKLEDDDWRATFFALGGSAFLRARDSESAERAREALDRLPRGMRDTFRIVDRAELDLLGSDPEAPFALAAAPGFVMDDAAEPPVMRPNHGMSHGHHPDLAGMNTGFIARGAGIQAGAAVEMLPLTCIAPLIAQLLGIELDAPDGIVYPGLLARG